MWHRSSRRPRSLHCSKHKHDRLPRLSVILTHIPPCRPGRRRGSKTREADPVPIRSPQFAARWVPARAPRGLSPAPRLAGMTFDKVLRVDLCQSPFASAGLRTRQPAHTGSADCEHGGSAHATSCLPDDSAHDFGCGRRGAAVRGCAKGRRMGKGRLLGVSRHPDRTGPLAQSKIAELR